MPNLPFVTVRVFIENKNKEVLFIRAVKEENKFTVPGGHLEFGEKAEDAASREVKEETGLNIKNIEFLTYSETLRGKGIDAEHYVVLRFKAELAYEDQALVLQAEEASEFMWMSSEDALNNDEVKSGAKKIIEEFFTKKEKKSLFSRECKNCEETKSSVEEYKSGWQRALADYNNLKNEVAKEKAEWAVWSEQRILEEFIPVYGNFKKAFAVQSGEMTKEQENWATGIKYIMKQYGDILKNHQVEEIKTVGEKFDPVYHEALGEEESESEEGTIVREIDGGYTVKEKVMKVAKVIISKGKS